jgi:RNA polymerase sigma-70 factor (ECF subfamily)
LTPGDCRALVTAARKGDEEAFADLYRLFARAVHGTLLARIPPGDAADLVQEVFLQAWSRLRELRDDSAFGGWICAIARRYAASHYRSRRTFEPLPADLASHGNPDADVAADAHAAIAAILTLPEAYRETLTLRLVEGLTGPEIASVTGLTPDSVRVNLHRGLALLRERLGVTS